ncbi:hypothetical protein BLA29_010321 [Euroglyphus maynei]|uniref:Uncharacterized protein n=1 Tax=Euroglyphus maynei TaxID=6958 RepID=A0A1Y3ATM5_EURMA|nr:hypothetical protein BLA29_010321 [Euroglyphus maynei]
MNVYWIMITAIIFVVDDDDDDDDVIINAMCKTNFRIKISNNGLYYASTLYQTQYTCHTYTQTI